MLARFWISVEIAAWLFFVSVGVCLFGFYRSGEEIGMPVLAVTLCFPAIAVLGLVLVSTLSSAFLPESKLRVPANLTWPVMHLAGQWLALKLTLNTGASLQAPPPPLQPALVWTEPSYYLTACTLQIVLLSALVLIGRKAQR